MNLRIWHRFKKNISFANVVIAIGICTTLTYIFSYLFPVTDNAFVVNNVRPVAAQVKGYITNLYIQNGDSVKKGEKLFTVFDKPYIYAVDQLSADLRAAEAKLKALQKALEKDKSILKQHQDIYTKLEQDDEKYTKAYAINAISLMTLQNSQQETKAAQSVMNASSKQVEIDEHEITAQKELIASTQAKLNNAKVELDETVVYAENNGVVQNMFLTVGTPVNINQPLFSFVETDEIYFQANFNETDLRKVHKGSKVLIFPRTYLGRKIFHGEVISEYWGANRQITDARSQMQNVTNENEWILLPQRLPVQIKVLDPDPKYPLRAGSSAYIYIKAD